MPPARLWSDRLIDAVEQVSSSSATIYRTVVIAQSRINKKAMAEITALKNGISRLTQTSERARVPTSDVRNNWFREALPSDDHNPKPLRFSSKAKDEVQGARSVGTGQDSMKKRGRDTKRRSKKRDAVIYL